MNQNKINLSLLALVFSLSLGFAFFNFSVSEAQTTDTTKPKPTVSPTLAPSPEPTIEIDPDEIEINQDVVNLSVRVVDRFNRPIAKLKKDDFTIYEDKVKQTIDYFTTEEVPTNYALVIDNSGSMRFLLEKVIEASKIIVNTNKPDDETEVVRFVSSQKIKIMEEFTNNKEDLFYALDNLFVEGGQTAIVDAIYLAAERTNEYEKTKDPNDRKRRALILVSDGEDRGSYYKVEQLFELLRESDVQIYAIGFVNELDNDGGFIRDSDRKKAIKFLNKLATETGGKAYFPDQVSELNGIAKDIASELRTQYLLSYSPTTDRNGKVRNIKVTVNDGPKKQKRIAITRTGISSGKKEKAPPTFQ